MRWLINYIRSCFCKHDWELIFNSTITDQNTGQPYNQIKVYRCKKCGYEKRYKAQ